MSARAPSHALGAALVAIAALASCVGSRVSEPGGVLFPCSHAFVPMGTAVARDYRVTARDPGVVPYRYTQSYAADGGPADGADGFTEAMSFSNGVRRRQELRCEPGGGWRALATSVEGASDAPASAIAAKGATVLPPPDAWRVGATWTDSGEISGTDLPALPALVAPGGRASVTGTVTVTSTIAAREDVDVPAGHYDTYRIDATTTQRVVVDTGILGKIPVELVTTTRTWYARGVGMVRQQAEPYGLTTELTAARGVDGLSSRSSGR